MLIIKYKNDVVLHSSVCPTSGIAAGDVTIWYQRIVSTLSLDGPDKWSLDRGFEKKLCLEE